MITKNNKEIKNFYKTHYVSADFVKSKSGIERGFGIGIDFNVETGLLKNSFSRILLLSKFSRDGVSASVNISSNLPNDLTEKELSELNKIYLNLASKQTELVDEWKKKHKARYLEVEEKKRVMKEFGYIVTSGQEE